MKLEISGQIFKKKERAATSSFIKICPVGTGLFYVDGQTDIHDEGNSHLSQFCERA